MGQVFNSNVLNLVKQKGFYHYEYMSHFEKFKKVFLSKKNFYSTLTSKAPVIKSTSMFLKFDVNLKWKQWNIMTN